MPTIYVNNDLISMVSETQKFQQRDAISQINDFLNVSPDGTVCVLYGLRRTGKTVMMLQSAGMIEDMTDKCAYILAKKYDCMTDIENSIWELKNSGKKFFFIDEITAVNDFVKFSDNLANDFAILGLHIVLAGTDSLKFKIAESNMLGRMEAIRTTRIPFREQSRLMPWISFSDYSKIGGILAKESILEKFFTDEKNSEYGNIRKIYTLSSIAENIQTSLTGIENIWPGKLVELCNKNEMTSLINLCAHYDSHKLLLEAINKDYASGEINELYSIFNRTLDMEILHKECLGRKYVASEHQNTLSIKNLQDRQIVLDQDLLDEVESSLMDLDVLVPTKSHIMGSQKGLIENRRNIFSQPALRWGQVDALINVTKNIAKDNDIKLPNEIFDNLGSQTHGKNLDDALFLEIMEQCCGECEVFRFNAPGKVAGETGEIDIIVALPYKQGFAAFEVKRNPRPKKDYLKHLHNEKYLAYLENQFGPRLDYAVVCPCEIQKNKANLKDYEHHFRNIDEFVINEIPNLVENLKEKSEDLEAHIDFRPF